jgi:ATP-dependent helicase Lhr and Lhr-like helicase
VLRYAGAMQALERFTPATVAWFGDAFAGPTAAQEAGWEAIARGDHTLIHAPTGSGKTLAAFLWAVDRLFAEPTPAASERCRVLYVSPMKALAYDVDRNLRAPLTGISLAARRLGIDPPPVATAMRTGDTPAAERRAMLRHPPDILITTPESLYLMLTSQVRRVLRTVQWVIVDEIHAVAGTKRGSHLALSLERLEEVTTTPPQRIGLSATQRPLQTIAEFLGGGTVEGDLWTPRPVTVVDAPREKVLDVEIVVPVEDMTRPGDVPPPGPADGPVVVDPPKRSIWPAVYPRLLELVLAHRSTIVFANSRGLAERIASELNGLAGEELAMAHHGSVSREQRLDIEDRLKRGELRAVVATSSLELGIDMAAVDLVILVESPTSVARGLQRVGRAGHQVGAPSRARVFPKHRGDLLETAVVVERMYAGAIEETRVPRNPLDVLAQQVVATVAVAPRRADEVYDLVRRAGPYRDLSRLSFDGLLDMLAGRFPSDEFSELRPRIVWDRVEGTLEPRGNARQLAVTNPGTIPDRGLYRVVLPEGGRVGELDEEMVYESRPGDVFVLGSSAWKISEITHDRVVVVPAPGEATARMPFWHGDTLGRPLELGKAIGEFVRTVGALDPDEAVGVLQTRYRLDPWAAANLGAFLAEEREATGTLPSDRTLVAERFRDEIGDWRIVLLSPFGARIHAPWALAARRRFRERHGTEVDVIWSDDGIVFRFPDADEPPDPASLLIDPDEVEELVVEEVGESALFTSRFREAAARALLLPRRRPGNRTPLWLQRRKAADLLSITKRFGSFPIVLETYREVLQDHFDLPSLRSVLGDVRSRTIRVAEVDTTAPSPFASSLLFDFVASFMYEYDAPVAERRAAALTLDRALLRDLLGEPEFRELLDADAIDQVERELQRLTDDRTARGPDGVDDLLRHLGPLSTEAVAARCADPDEAPGWLSELEGRRRIAAVRIGGEPRWAVMDDLARLRDALGVAPPVGVAETLLEPVADPLGDVVGRYARTHGPFAALAAATDLGLPQAAVAEVLERLEAAGRVHQGAFRPGGHGVEWVDAEVLRRLRRRSLAVLRSEVEPVEPAALGRFLPTWHGIGSTARRPDRVDEILRQIQGAAIPASILETDVFPARMDYDERDLDALAASGEVVWVGAGALGVADGRVALYRRDRVAALHWADPGPAPDGARHDAIRSHLADRGASFFADLYASVGGGDPGDVVEALWDLVWAGEVTNDTLAPLRAFLLGTRKRSSGGKPRPPGATPPRASGRWYPVADLIPTVPPPEATATARAEQLLERHGIVTREAVLAEGVPGGFAGLYPVLATMEDAGRVRRGYFVEGRGGAQFALPGAVDRLRHASDPGGPVLLAAADPANPYGAVLPWPDHEAGRPARRAGAHVVLAAGDLAAFVETGGRRVLTFTGADPETVAAALADLAAGRYRRLTVETIDGVAAAGTPVGKAMAHDGFTPGYKGLVHRRGAGSRA